MTKPLRDYFVGNFKAVIITGLFIISLFGIILFLGQQSENIIQPNKLNIQLASEECEKYKLNFKEKLNEISRDNEELTNDILISDDFYTKFLSGIKEFENRNEYIDIYYHSLPNIQTEKCWVIIKVVYKYDQYSYSYKLLEIGEKPRIIFELASIENFPGGQIRVKSKFKNEMFLVKTKVIEEVNENIQLFNGYEIVTDSIIFTYQIQENGFELINRDSVRIIKI